MAETEIIIQQNNQNKNAFRGQKLIFQWYSYSYTSQYNLTCAARGSPSSKAAQRGQKTSGANQSVVHNM